MGKFSYVLKNTILNMRRTPLLVFATIIAVLVSSFLVFTTLSARSIVQNITLRWLSGIHVVVFLDDRIDLKDVRVVDWTPIGSLIPKIDKLESKRYDPYYVGINNSVWHFLHRL